MNNILEFTGSCVLQLAQALTIPGSNSMLHYTNKPAFLVSYNIRVIIGKPEGEATNLDAQVAKHLYTYMYICLSQSVTDTSLVASKSYL